MDKHHVARGITRPTMGVGTDCYDDRRGHIGGGRWPPIAICDHHGHHYICPGCENDVAGFPIAELLSGSTALRC